MTPEENELLTRVGPRTPMGALLRQYWMPLLRSEEVIESAPPVRYRLLGENLVVFRNRDGSLGLLEHTCPHRVASLGFGRNEGDGLRCIYHGWKFAADGHCVDIPSEPTESSLCKKVSATSYPCRESNGIIWAYLGSRSEPPPLPQLGWALVPASHRGALRYQRACNWLQALEGDVDTVHLGWLHANFAADGSRTIPTFAKDRWMQDVVFDDRAHLDVAVSPVRVTIGARRQHDEASWYWRVTEFLMPIHTSLPSVGTDYRAKVFVPLDDEHTMVWETNWSDQPLSETMRKGLQGRVLGFLPDENQWLGRDRMAPVDADTLFGGDGMLPLQDGAIQLSMGPIADRTKEHLAASDAAVIAVRRLLARSELAWREQGLTPPGVDEPDAYAYHGRQFILDRQADWRLVCS